jgi:hypothetical protein
MKRTIAALLLAAFASVSFAQGAQGDADPYRSSAGQSESDNVVQSYGG